MAVCPYWGKECEYWEQDENNPIGECIAVFQQQCDEIRRARIYEDKDFEP